MNLIFISTGLYPNQHAAAIRHSTIAQGIVEDGHLLNFFLLTAQPWKKDEIIYKGVNYKSLNSYNGSNKFKKIFHILKALKNVKKSIININKNLAIDGIVIFSIDILVLNNLITFSKKNNFKVFHERTELPYIIGRGTSIISILQYNFYIKKLIPKFDGIFVISDKIKKMILSYNRNVEKILTVVDIAFFDAPNQRIYNFPYIAYCGNMESTKDGLPILIESFAQLSLNFPSYKLLLIGQNTDSVETMKIINDISKFKIQDKVVFTGFINREEMPQLLNGAELLVVSKPDNEQNSGNFPIKIGEYLATGVPIVVTKVGEISKFIKDGLTGYLAIPNSPLSFYEKMLEALSDHERSVRIGQNGKKLAESIFDYKIQAKKMTEYIKQTK